MMIYNEFKGLKLSALGMGTMRLPLIDGKNDQIDEAASAKMIAVAMECGINYYDTAWGYHDGNSEIVMGKLLSEYPRDSFYLASKFPGYDLANMEKIQEVFEKQLEKCQVEYFDFYLIHNVCEKNVDAYLDEKYGLLNYLLEQKAKGKIRHLGFSTHASFEQFKRFLDAYGEHMEFCQIQLNYLDWFLQRACDKVELLNERNIPIWVMEPLRGGKLSTLSEWATASLLELRPDEKVPAWAFRYLQSVPGVKVILSGMSNEEQILDNVRTFECDCPLNDREMSVLMDIAEKMVAGVPCTACRYCTSYCPQALDIPKLLELYNEHSFSQGGFLAPMYLGTLPVEKQPSACIGCRSCEAVCPQKIKISETLADFATKLK